MRTVSDHVQVQTAIESASAADAMAEALVERGLVACAQVLGPVRSTYRWRGAVEHAAEHLLLCKTTAPMADAVVAAIRELHAYEVPEIIVVPIAGGLAEYLGWIDESVREPPGAS